MRCNSARDATAWVRVNVCKGMLHSCGHFAAGALPPAFHLNSNDLEMQLS